MQFITHNKWVQLPKSAHTLLNLHQKQSLFFSSLWFSNLINATLNNEQTVLIACVKNKDEYVAILPLITNPSGHWQSLSNYYSSLFTLLLTNKNQSNVLTCLINGLNTLAIKSLQLEPIDKNDNNIKQFHLHMLLDGFDCFEHFKFYNWSHPIAGQSFKNYMDSRPSHVRNTIERKHRKLTREHNYTITLYTNKHIQQALADYEQVYLASWKANERFIHFINQFVNVLAKKGWLRLAIMYAEQTPIAAQIWVVVHKKANIFRLVYDEKWKQFSPGSILTRYLVKHVIEQDKVDELDFLTGNEKYKQEWMSQRKERWSYTFSKKEKPKSRLRNFMSFFNRK